MKSLKLFLVAALFALPAWAFEPYNVYKEYQISASTSATAGQLLAFDTFLSGPKKVQLEAVSGRIVFKFGDSTVTADATVTSNTLADGNFSIADGAIVDVTFPSGTPYKYVSVDMAASTGTAIVRLIR